MREPRSILDFLRQQARSHPDFARYVGIKLQIFKLHNQDIARLSDDEILCQKVNLGGITLGQLLLDQWENRPENDKRPV